MRAFATIALLAWSALSAHAAFAWGVEGHAVVAAVAAQHLTPEAKKQLELLLGAHAESQMVAVASWADEIRSEQPDTRPLHFVDIPLDSEGYNPGRDCPGGKCIVQAISDYAAVLKDTSKTTEQRTIALKWLIHLIGDIHQPLHCADHMDRGGNKVKVILGDKLRNLHTVWDDDVVTAIAPSQTAIVASINSMLTPDFESKVPLGPPAAWANESWKVAKAKVYGPLKLDELGAEATVLPTNYLPNATHVAQQQMAVAAWRLATVLNTVLS